MQISELASLSGVTVHAIRHYESLGLIEAVRLPSGYRKFDESVIRELRFITMSRQCGFSLPQIAEVLPVETRLYVPKVLAMVNTRAGVTPEELAAIVVRY